MAQHSTLAVNKHARNSFSIADTYEAGIRLSGAEVKSCKKGSITLKGSYASVSNDGVPRLIGCHIAPYPPARREQDHYQPTHPRILLLNKKEIRHLIGKLKQKGFSLIPLEVVNKKGIIKIILGLGSGKKEYEKREALKKRETNRAIRRKLKQ